MTTTEQDVAAPGQPVGADATANLWLAPPLICSQAEFDEMEQVLRSVLTEAWTRL